MITLPENLDKLSEENNLEVFYLLEIDGKYFTTAMHDIFINGNLYVSNELIAELAKPTLSSDIDSNRYELILINAEAYLSADFIEKSVGEYVRVSTGFILPETDSPLNIDDSTITVYYGYIEGTTRLFNLSEVGEKVIKLSLSSPMGNLDGSRPFTTDPSFMQHYNLGDTCFDRVRQANDTTTLIWGN